MVRRSLDFDFFKRRKLKPLKKPEADKIEEAVFDDGVDGVDDDDDDDHDALPRRFIERHFASNIRSEVCNGRYHWTVSYTLVVALLAILSLFSDFQATIGFQWLSLCQLVQLSKEASNISNTELFGIRQDQYV